MVVMGNGFDLVQRATMKVLPSYDEFSQNTSPAEVSGLLFVLCEEDIFTGCQMFSKVSTCFLSCGRGLL